MGSLFREEDGDAVVEAAILFPIMILIFAALFLLAVYLPTRAALQRATQYAATAIATEESDTWLCFDEDSMSYVWETDKSLIPNVYVAFFSGFGDTTSKGEKITITIEGQGLSAKAGNLSVVCYPVNKILYKEIVVTASREYTMPVNLSIIGFPKTLSIVATSTSVVLNGDEFVRNIDLATDFVEYISKKFGLSDTAGSISSALGKVSSFFGW